MNTPQAKALSGLRVLVTRPAHQAEPFCRLLAAAGAVALRLPVIEITGPRDPNQAARAIAGVGAADLAIFISANAVEGAHALAPMPWPELPAERIAAVGQATARALASLNMSPAVMPTRDFDSEALLAMPELANVRNKSVIIFRGEGGRELLRDKLTSRGARVKYVETYRRERPAVDTETLENALAPDGADAVVVTSDAGLENLLALATTSQADALRALPLVVNSQRNAQKARALGFTQTVLVPSTPGDRGQLEALIDWHRNRHRQR